MRLVLWLVAAVAFAQLPDRPSLPDEWGYRPAEGSIVSVNPPSFSWVVEKAATAYDVQWADNAGFRNASTAADLRWTVYTHHGPLKRGEWWWRYRIVDSVGQPGVWSRARGFTIAQDAAVLPQPRFDELKKRIPREHPRLFVRAEDLPRFSAWAEGEGKERWRAFLQRADELTKAEPAPEPTVRGSSRDPATRDHWWSNRVQTLRATQEAEILAFAWLVTRQDKYAGPARRFTLKLAGWDPDGPTNFALNCEAAKPMIYGLARSYDWAWPLLAEAERERVRAVLLRRAQDAWKSGEVREGAGHLNQPYGSHANRIWHKLAENAIATLGETPESDLFLEYALTKFFGAYPVWSDDDGGWHEGLSYLSGYMSKVITWMEMARQVGIEAHRKPFFSRIGDYPMYAAPPGTPDMGFGDLSSGQPNPSGWGFLHYFAAANRNPHWAWWLNSWNLRAGADDPVLELLLASRQKIEPRPPSGLPPSKVFHGTGVAVLNTNLPDGLKNVQLRFKASPMGRASHGHDPHNSFTLNAYGVGLLVNNVYRDLYGSPFHRGVWETRSQNAVLVNGKGQKPHSMDLGGRIIQSRFEDGFDYVAGDATASYEGELRRAIRHVFFLKPDLIAIADDVAAARPSLFQWMLHSPGEFSVDEAAQRLTLDRKKAGAVIDYIAPSALTLRQWTGYSPDQDHAYFASIKRAPIPPQWHVEAGSVTPVESTFVVTMVRVFEGLPARIAVPRIDRRDGVVRVDAGDATLAFDREKAVVARGGREWTVRYAK